jgi:hypothetical protein
MISENAFASERLLSIAVIGLMRAPWRSIYSTPTATSRCGMGDALSYTGRHGWNAQLLAAAAGKKGAASEAGAVTSGC